VFPILFRIPRFGDLSTGTIVLELALGAACLLGWLYLRTKGRKEGLASWLNLGAFLVVAHVVFSQWIEGKITIFTFGVVIIVAFFVAITYILRHTRRMGLDDKKVFDFAFWMLVVGIVGSRFLYAYLNFDEFSGKKWEIFKIWHGGLVWYGGMIPAIPVGIYLLRRARMPVLAMCDVCGAALMLALGIGRWACFLAGDDYGRPTDLPWAITFYNPECLVADGLLGVPLHPTQMYMSLNAIWIFYFTDLVRRRSKYAGQAFAFMLAAYAVGRGLFIEPFRGDFVERNPGWRHHLASMLRIEKGEGTPAVELKRGAAVSSKEGIRGRLLGDLSLPAGAASGEVSAISDDPVRGGGAGPLQNAYAPPWEIAEVEGLPAGASVEARPVATPGRGRSGWYDSHLPVPPGYVSTSQWISVLVVGGAVLAWLTARRLRVPVMPPPAG
jgi:phosphatidylglycerol:prolipoprotein diacylglycerol transferase